MPALCRSSWSALFIVITGLGYASTSQAKPVGFTSGAWTGSVSCGGTTSQVSGTTLAACEAALAASEEDCLALGELPTSQACTETGYHWTSADGMNHTSPIVISVGGGTTRPWVTGIDASSSAVVKKTPIGLGAGPTRGSGAGHPPPLGLRSPAVLEPGVAQEDATCPDLTLDLERDCDDDVLEAVDLCEDGGDPYACLPADLEASDACFAALEALDEADCDGSEAR